MQSQKSKPIPVVTGYLAPGSKQIKVWCEHCGRYHLHGAPDGMADDYEHRVAALKRRRRPFRYPRR